MANLRKLVSGRWAASWNSISGQVGSYEFGSVLGLFVLNDDGSLTGEFRFRQGTEYGVKSFTGTFEVLRNLRRKVVDGAASLNIENGNTNTLSFVRINSDELAFVVDHAVKTADGTPRSLMSQGTLHRIKTPWWLFWNPFDRVWNLFRSRKLA